MKCSSSMKKRMNVKDLIWFQQLLDSLQRTCCSRLWRALWSTEKKTKKRWNGHSKLAIANFCWNCSCMCPEMIERWSIHWYLSMARNWVQLFLDLAMGGSRGIGQIFDMRVSFTTRADVATMVGWILRDFKWNYSWMRWSCRWLADPCSWTNCSRNTERTTILQSQGFLCCV